MARRKAMCLAPHEDSILRDLYVETNIPLCQFKQRIRDGQRFLREWNQRSGRCDEWGDVLHYMVTCRKDKKNRGWPTLGDGHARLADPDPDDLSKQEWGILEEVYKELLLDQSLGSDNLLYDKKLRSTLAREFVSRGGRNMSSSDLVAILFASRKRGELIGLCPNKDEGTDGDDLGWGDMKDVG